MVALWIATFAVQQRRWPTSTRWSRCAFLLSDSCFHLTLFAFTLYVYVQGGPQKSKPLSRIIITYIVLNTVIKAEFFINFGYEMSTTIYGNKSVLNILCDLICDMITCVWSCNMGKINVYDSHDWKTEKKEKIWKSKKFLRKSPSKRSFTNGIHSLLKRADARECWHHLPYMWRISLVCGSGIATDVTK